MGHQTDIFIEVFNYSVSNYMFYSFRRVRCEQNWPITFGFDSVNTFVYSSGNMPDSNDFCNSIVNGLTWLFLQVLCSMAGRPYVPCAEFEAGSVNS